MHVRKFSLSTGQTLSILTAALVLAVLAVGIAMTWVTLRRAALDTAYDRVARGVRPVARGDDQQGADHVTHTHLLMSAPERCDGVPTPATLQEPSVPP